MSMSLVEQKKQQWARERAEMSEWFAPWGVSKREFQQQEKSHFVSTLDLRNDDGDGLSFRQRSPSLPPLSKNDIKQPAVPRSRLEVFSRNVHNGRQKPKCCEDEGDTSGYASDSIPHLTNNRWPEKHPHQEFPSMIKEEYGNQHNPESKLSYRNQRRENSRAPSRQQNWSRESNSSVEEGRPKWGDKGIAVGKLWEPQDPTARLPQVHDQSKNKPAWVERGLNMVDNGFSEVLMIDQHSTTVSECFNDIASNSGSDSGRNTFIRGQNVPIEENLKAEREARRLKALEVQNIILEQIEVREKGKKEEREKRLWEERNEEMRIRRERQQDLERLEEEKRKIEEKKENERRKHQALKEAIEQAEQKAKEEKENIRRSKIRLQADISPTKETEQTNFRRGSIIFTKEDERESMLESNLSNRLFYSTDNISNTSDSNVRSSSRPKTKELIDSHFNESMKSASMQNFNMILQNQSLPLSDGSVSMIQIPMNPDLLSNANNNVQYAFLVPQPANSLFGCFQQPLSIQPLVISPLISLEHKPGNDDKQNRVLTPSKYRNCHLRDASTQTESINTESPNPVERCDKYNTKFTDTNLDQSSPDLEFNEEKTMFSPNKKDKKGQLEEKFKKEIENRPKWGVNRPPMQYKKQSEKDLFYSQKRKLRQRSRLPEKRYSSHSSDESRSPSPPRNDLSNRCIEEKSGLRRSLSQNHWRTKQNADNPTKSNVNIETINSLEVNLNGQVVIGEEVVETDHNKFLEDLKQPEKSRITLSQKFINDKHGNPRMWIDNKLDEDTDKEAVSFPKQVCRGEVRKKIVDRMNLITKGKHDLGDDVDVENPTSLNQLRSLRDSLKKHQTLWSRDRNPQISSRFKSGYELDLE